MKTIDGFSAKEAGELESLLGYQFKDPQLLRLAFLHRSFSNEKPFSQKESYERLEFLGDAVLELVISEYLYREFPNLEEGSLTRLRAKAVQSETLAEVAKELGLEEYLFLGRGERKTKGRFRDSILGDVLEAVFGGIYLDGGFSAARRSILSIFRDILRDRERLLLHSSNYKSILQEYWQQEFKTQGIRYHVFREEGPENDKTFFVHCYCEDILRGTGSGKNKKQAEQKAAKEALISLGVEI